jgi:proline dehydrogenase
MSENKWLSHHIPKMKFVREAVKKFMPGETEEAALEASKKYFSIEIPTVFTKLGENIISLNDAEILRYHYLNLVDKIKESRMNIEISVKLTQLGFDLSEEKTKIFANEIVNKVDSELGNTFFIDIEGSSYTQRTINFYKGILKDSQNVGLCLQAYLYRTEQDLIDLLKLNSSIRMVKGAYKEPADIAFQKKIKVDENYFLLAKMMMNATLQKNSRMIYATHDEKLISKIIEEAKMIGLKNEQLEFQMLYGIKSSLQRKLAAEGFKVRVLISYGQSWFPWYMRRLAERPANVWFVLKNLFS